MMAVVVRIMPFLTMILLYGYMDQVVVQAQTKQAAIPDIPKKIADEHTPMEYVARMMEQVYLRPVTYEDPIMSWIDDFQQIQNSRGEIIKIKKRRSFEMPGEANRLKTPTISVELLQRIVDAYHEQTDGPRFKIESSRWGLHIIPDQVRNDQGQYTKAITFLDRSISVPVENRTPSGHFEAICEAINHSMVAGIKLHSFTPYVDGYFSQVPLSRMPSDEEMMQTEFSWGTEGSTARDALINLFEQSATTLTWRLLCDSHNLSQPLCALNIGPMEVNYTETGGRTYESPLFHDRIKKND
ncbi:MAG: hypothetical protein JXA73_20600 [Acidobacteria bacterium]|nr:hypothetical protein [Acidobacteriota bacterium]